MVMPASSTSKTERRDMTLKLLKVALNPNQTNKIDQLSIKVKKYQ